MLLFNEKEKKKKISSRLYVLLTLISRYSISPLSLKNNISLIRGKYFLKEQKKRKEGLLDYLCRHFDLSIRSIWSPFPPFFEKNPRSLLVKSSSTRASTLAEISALSRCIFFPRSWQSNIWKISHPSIRESSCHPRFDRHMLLAFLSKFFSPLKGKRWSSSSSLSNPGLLDDF